MEGFVLNSIHRSGAARMSHGNGSSLSDLERQAESSRIELTQTVDELNSRLTPEALKREAKDYARQTGQQWLDTIETRARDNPLAAVAVAAGLALPAWRMISSIPAPILLIGAGLAMSRRSSTGSTGASREFGQSSAPALGERASGLARAAGEKATDMIEDTQHKADVISSRVSEAVAGTVATAREMASETAATVTETTRDMTRQAADKMNQARGSMTETFERYPLLVGGLAFAIGGLLASSLPVTRSENRLMGNASDAVKNRARDIAEEGVEVVQSAAGAVYEDVAAETREQGLTPETARGAVKNAMEQASTIVERAAAAVERSGPKSTTGRPAGNHKFVNSESDNG